MNEIEKQIFKYRRLYEIGVAIYRYNMEGEFMRNAIAYRDKADKLEKQLNEKSL